MGTVLHYVQDFLQKYFTVPDIYISDIIEIIIIAVIVYYLIVWFQRSKAWSLLRGILVLVIFMIIAAMFNLTTLLWIINRMLSVGIIAIVVIFQPELRRALEELGRRNVIFRMLNLGNDEEDGISDKSVDELTRAIVEMSKAKTGALIVVSREHDLSQYIETGIRLDSKITSQLIINVFEKNTPLHDGAMIIEKDRISAATCYLPLSDSTQISKALGTRHRAGLGMSEATDALVVVVSEETGVISIAQDGKLESSIDAASLKNRLIETRHKNDIKKKKSRGKRRHREKGNCAN